jgi:L-alanine-DL-glutamate epimerase-like enolase superfamily enzyme
MVRSPLAVGEHYGARYDIYKLIENQLIDYARISLPNTGGITEFRKKATICETHYVGLVPHFTGPVCMSAQVHMCGPFPGPVLAETTRGSNPEENPHVKQSYDFKNGKIWFNQRPGIGVELDMSRLQQMMEVTAPTKYYPLYHRPDGSMTNW